MSKTVRFLIAAALVSGGTLGASVSHAQQAPASSKEATPPLRYEVTPFLGYRFGGDFDLEGVDGGADLNSHASFAIALNLRLDEVSQYELFYSRQATSLERSSPVSPFDIDVHYLHIGGTLVPNPELPLTPYIAGGLGITLLNPQTGDDDTRFSISLAGGVRVPINPRFGLRFEARGYLTLVDKDSAFFCASGSFGGACAIRASGSTFIQYELLAGAVFAF